MSAVFIYLAIGAAIVGLLTDRMDADSPVGYAVSITLWPFIAITVAASMLRDAAKQWANS